MGNQYFLAMDRPDPPDRHEHPLDLPLDYLDADPRHGDVVEFTDQRDAMEAA